MNLLDLHKRLKSIVEIVGDECAAELPVSLCIEDVDGDETAALLGDLAVVTSATSCKPMRVELVNAGFK